MKIVAYIDGVNLHKGILLQLGWKLDYRRFRAHLRHHYGVECAYLFHGYVPEYRSMYRDLTNWGYRLVFRSTSRGANGKIKGNCDTDLAVHAIAGCCENRYDKAFLISADGDLTSVTSFLASRGKLQGIIAPSRKSCSRLYRRSGIRPVLLENLRGELEYIRPPGLADSLATIDRDLESDFLSLAQRYLSKEAHQS